MKKMNVILLILLICSSCAKSQSQRIGGPCEGCEAIYEYQDKVLKPIDTLPGFISGLNKIKVSGTVFKQDEQTPASNVILYIYHTDDKGKYPVKSSSKGWEERHGYLRTWLKTDAKGNYAFYTTRPASYPNSTVPQHIHITIKEPHISEYYVEDFYFADDPNITSNILNRERPRGGSGVIKLTNGSNSVKEATRDIILGKHIPNY